MRLAARFINPAAAETEDQIRARRTACAQAAVLGLGTMGLTTTGESRVFAGFKTWAAIVRWVNERPLSDAECDARADLEHAAHREFMALHPRDARDLACKAWVAMRAIDSFCDTSAPAMFCADDPDDMASVFAADVAVMFPELIAIARGERDD